MNPLENTPNNLAQRLTDSGYKVSTMNVITEAVRSLFGVNSLKLPPSIQHTLSHTQEQIQKRIPDAPPTKSIHSESTT